MNTAFRRLRSRSTRGFPVTGAIGGEKRGEVAAAAERVTERAEVEALFRAFLTRGGIVA